MCSNYRYVPALLLKLHFNIFNTLSIIHLVFFLFEVVEVLYCIVICVVPMLLEQEFQGKERRKFRAGVGNDHGILLYGIGKKLIHEENSGEGKGTIPEKSGLGTGILNGLQRFPKHSGLE
jgi:hypothetical protein